MIPAPRTDPPAHVARLLTEATERTIRHRAALETTPIYDALAAERPVETP